MLFHKLFWRTGLKFTNMLPRLFSCDHVHVCMGVPMHGQRQRICQMLSPFLSVLGYTCFLNFLHFVYQYFLASNKQVLNLIWPKILPTVTCPHRALRTMQSHSFFLDFPPTCQAADPCYSLSPSGKQMCKCTARVRVHVWSVCVCPLFCRAGSNLSPPSPCSWLRA